MLQACCRARISGSVIDDPGEFVCLARVSPPDTSAKPREAGTDNSELLSVLVPDLDVQCFVEKLLILWGSSLQFGSDVSC